MQMSEELAKAISHELVGFYKEKNVPTRAALVARLRIRYPSLSHPRLDLTIAKALNRLVNLGTLRRIEGKFYAPGKCYCKEGKDGQVETKEG